MPSDEVLRMSDAAIPIDRGALTRLIQQQGADFQDSLTERHAHLFADVAVLISSAHLAQMRAVIAAVEQVVAIPAWSTAQDDMRCKGVFFGYDFHLNETGAHLIEINTNAGGAFLNALLLQSQQTTALPGIAVAQESLELAFVEMFRHEWHLEHGDEPLNCIAIVDEQLEEQYLYPEFLLARQIFERAGILALIADPRELNAHADGLYLGAQKIELVYNRLTDFALEKYPALLNAYRNRQVVLTPNPQAYDRYADKRNLVRLSDAATLAALGVDGEVISVLCNGVPQTREVRALDTERWWAERKQWFFKPVSGYGAKGAYRGDKLTKRVFEEIVVGDYVAQKLAPPGECMATVNGENAALKYDVRCYVYDGRIQLVAARLYQGQTTNFRTPGGGFASVRADN